MAGTNRCLTVGGPCKIKLCDDSILVSEGDVTVTIAKEFRDLESSLAGKVGKLLTKTVVEIKFTPVPIPAYAPLLISLQPTNIGESIFGCEDCYLEIHGRDATKLRFLAAAVSDPPELRFSAKQNLFGEVTYRAVVSDETDIATANAVKTLTTGSFTEPGQASDVSQWITRGSALKWGDDAPFNAITTEDGVTLKIGYELEDKVDDLNGYYDSKLTAVTATVKFKPNNLSEADFFTAFPVDGAGAVGGKNLADLAREMIVKHSPASGGVKVTLAAVAMTNGGMGWGRSIPRQGEWNAEAVGSVTENVPDPLYLIELVAAPVNTVVPTIDDTTPTEGQTLTTTPGTWTGVPTPTLTRKWQKNVAGTWTDIGGATGLTYVVQVGDVGLTLRVVETGTNDGGAASANSLATSAVAGA